MLGDASRNSGRRFDTSHELFGRTFFPIIPGFQLLEQLKLGMTSFFSNRLRGQRLPLREFIE